MILKFDTLYVVKRDVTNPKPDRRKADREVFSLPVIRKGTRLVCREYVCREYCVDRDARPYATLEVAGRGYYQTGSSENRISEHRSPRAVNRAGEEVGPSLWELLTADGVLEEQPIENVDDALLSVDENASAMEVLDALVILGRVSLAEVLAVAKAVDEAGDARSAVVRLTDPKREGGAL